jgi:hypothetical protein
MKYIVIFENGYCGCTDVHCVIANNEKQVYNYAREWLPEYAGSYEYLITMDMEDEEIENLYDTQEYEDYWEGCYFEYFEATPELEEEYYIDEETEWKDIR